MNLICYLSNGYPTIESSIEMAKTYVEAGCDIIEIDFPSHNPFLESEYIAGRMAEALKVCDDFDKYMDGMIEVKKQLPDTKFILMVYESTVEEIGLQKFIDFCIQNNFCDMILVGLKDETIKNKIIAKGLRVSCYVQFSLLEQEVEYALKSNGFVYLQAVAAPGQMNPKYPELKDCIKYLRDRGLKTPIYCGVGVHAPQDAAMVKASGADAAFLGSTILKLHDDKPALMSMIRKFKEQC
jgi:tryptophan synthase alpha chain